MLLIAIALGLLISISNVVTMLIFVSQQRNGECEGNEVRWNDRKQTKSIRILWQLATVRFRLDGDIHSALIELETKQRKYHYLHEY